jgi:hypothetical protein
MQNEQDVGGENQRRTNSGWPIDVLGGGGDQGGDLNVEQSGKKNDPGEDENVPVGEVTVAPQGPPEQQVVHQLDDDPKEQNRVSAFSTERVPDRI